MRRQVTFLLFLVMMFTSSFVLFPRKLHVQQVKWRPELTQSVSGFAFPNDEIDINRPHAADVKRLASLLANVSAYMAYNPVQSVAVINQNLGFFYSRNITRSDIAVSY